jgi:hypothetical protein
MFWRYRLIPTADTERRHPNKSQRDQPEPSVAQFKPEFCHITNLLLVSPKSDEGG